MPISTLGRTLGYAGLIPFVGLALLSWTDVPVVQRPHQLLITYAAVILSFMGAVHWGIALSRSKDDAVLQLGISVVPALLAWLALMLPLVYAYSLLIISFIALCVYDKYVNRQGLFPAWYLPMRIILTTVVVLCLVLAATAVVV